ncbi:hypothetical protein AAG570_001548 [Ranatra chinensis]|uniref:Uncharacterized protein n=1 Tax=Ranatra chinensis TaxID=642074 RepID=A0ABD0Y8V5_9HEMI
MAQARGLIIPHRRGPPKGPEKKGMSTRKKERLRGTSKQPRSDTEPEAAKVVSPNTFIIEPTRPFNRDLAQKTLDTVFEGLCSRYKYTKETGPKFAKLAANVLLVVIRDLKFSRYKLVCSVDIVENIRQTYASSISQLYDTNYDQVVATSQNNMYCFATAVVYGLYFD